MAGAGYKLFNTGDVLTAQQVNEYLMQQTVMVFADASARTTALSGVLAEGMISYLKDTNAVERYDGSTWSAIGAGDIEGVTAGTGISGGGTSGTVTITNSMATAIDAKGDLIAGTGADTFSRLAVGTDGLFLQADSTAATGLKWAAAGAALVGCRATKTSNQTLSSATSTAVTFNAEDYDTDGFHSTSTNTSRLTIPTGKGGKYLIIGRIMFDISTSSQRRLDLYKNGNLEIINVARPDNSAIEYTQQINTMINTVAGDYFELYAFQNSGGNVSILGSGQPGSCEFSIFYLGA